MNKQQRKMSVSVELTEEELIRAEALLATAIKRGFDQSEAVIYVWEDDCSISSIQVILKYTTENGSVESAGTTEHPHTYAVCPKTDFAYWHPNAEPSWSNAKLISAAKKMNPGYRDAMLAIASKPATTTKSVKNSSKKSSIKASARRKAAV
jgi:hypothetical protein